MSVYYEKLNDRDLWIDGQSSLSVDNICDRIFSGEPIEDVFRSNLISERDKNEVTKFLKLVPELTGIEFVFKEKESVGGLDTSFSIDDAYKSLNVEKFLVKLLKAEIEKKGLDTSQALLRLERIESELHMFKEHGIYDVLATCCFIVDKLKSNKIVWGPGRGSACCSYVLYLIGIHDIDSVYFELEMNEFLR